MIVLGHGSDNCVDPGVGRDRLEVEGSSDLEALGKSLTQVLIEDQNLICVSTQRACGNLGIVLMWFCVHVLSDGMNSFIDTM